MCHGLAPRVVRLVLAGASSDKDYSVQFEKDDSCERCYVVFWEDGHLKKVCVGSESLERPMPLSELKPLSRVIESVEGQQLPVAVRGISLSLLRVLGDERADGRRFAIQQSFGENLFLEVFHQAHQDVFGMIEVVTLFVILRMRSNLL